MNTVIEKYKRSPLASSPASVAVLGAKPLSLSFFSPSSAEPVSKLSYHLAIICVLKPL